MVDTLVRLGNQLNKPSYRFLKGDLIALSLEKCTEGRLLYVDEEGYDSVDVETGVKYELKSVANMFSAKNTISGRVSLANTNKSEFKQTFDYLLCIQTDPKKFAIAQLTWKECYDNCVKLDGQFNLNKHVPVSNWICETGDTYVKPDLNMVKLNPRDLFKEVL
jgi:hypothetical protein